jgi:hypothetical protein
MKMITLETVVRTKPLLSKEEHRIAEQIECLAKSRLNEKLAKISDCDLVDIAAPAGQAIRRAYLDLVNAARALDDAVYNGSELDLGLFKRTWERDTSAATSCCFAISALVAIAFISSAVGISIWGFDVHGVPTSNITALAAYIDGVQMSENAVCTIESQNTFKLDKFLGWPDTNVFWNLYGGLILGLIFGFLDNFGLFYGMGALDSFFYDFGFNIAAGIMQICRHNVNTSKEDPSDLLIDLHTVTTDLMSGLGNTFSDLLGVALGTAALEIAKAGMNVDPAFWVLDLVAIVLGCLLGCFMPVLVKHKELLGGKSMRSKATLISTFAWINIFGLFVAVFFAGVPYSEFHVASAVIVCFNITFLVVMLLVAYFAGGSVRRTAVCYLKRA